MEPPKKPQGAGKGSAPRPVKGSVYRDNHEKIFGRKKNNLEKCRGSLKELVRKLEEVDGTNTKH